jgi:serine protease Do
MTMKQILFKISAAVIATLICVPAINAQEEKLKEKEKPAKDVEHITITRKGDKNEKVTVVIDGDKITVNGKDINDLKDGDITVRKSRLRSMNNLSGFTAPGAYPFSEGKDVWGLLSGDQNRAMLGVVTEKADAGVKVIEVTKESAAEKAGLKEGDIITKIGDTRVNSPDELSEAVKKNKPGDKVSVTYLRDKKENKATAELTKWKGVSGFSFGPGSQNWDFKMPDMKLHELEIPRAPRVRVYDAFGYNMGQPKLGLSVQDTDDGKGVKVIEVDEESNAAKAGVKENDIITHVNDKEINSADEISRMVKESKDKATLNLKLKRDGKSQTIEVKMPRKLKTADL